MSTYRVNHAYADKTVGDTVNGADLLPGDLAFLVLTGAITPTNATTTAPKRGKKDITKDED
jgi:hypothetical protein